MARDAKATVEEFWRIQDAGDYTRTLPLFSEDAVVVDPVYGTFEGRDAIGAFMAKMVEETARRGVRFRAVEIAGGGDTAWSQWVAETPDGEIQGCGLYPRPRRPAHLLSRLHEPLVAGPAAAGRPARRRRMRLEGSCHCRAVRFCLESPHPYPFNLCYCSICRKTAGGGGFAINLSGVNESLEVAGREHVRVYRARIRREVGGTFEESPARRHFCGECGSPLWLWDPRWPELVHPLASAIDTPLPVPPERTHLLLGSKAPWVEVRADANDRQYEGYPEESIAEWHERLGLADPA